MIECMTSPVRVHRAMLCRDGSPLPCGEHGCAVSTALTELVGDHYAMAEIERPEGRFTLIIDAEWLTFVQQLTAGQPQDLVDVGELPRSMLRAVVAGWSDEWRSCDSELEICEAADGIPHLRLVRSQARSA